MCACKREKEGKRENQRDTTLWGQGFLDEAVQHEALVPEESEPGWLLSGRTHGGRSFSYSRSTPVHPSHSLTLTPYISPPPWGQGFLDEAVHHEALLGEAQAQLEAMQDELHRLVRFCQTYI